MSGYKLSASQVNCFVMKSLKTFSVNKDTGSLYGEQDRYPRDHSVHNFVESNINRCLIRESN